ncbi:MAG: hypothetical protein ACJ8F7_09110 [Gemmataceae bacterium]
MFHRFGLSLVLPMLLAAAVSAQQSPQSVPITADEVEVRAGGSPLFPATGKLRRGDTVYVRASKDGWLEIVPPAGSLSWVNAESVDLLVGTRTLAVKADPAAQVRVGNAQVPAPLLVDAHVALEKGAQVFAVAEKPVKAEKGDWWPIQPVTGEVRYIPASAIASPQIAAKSPSGNGAPTRTGGDPRLAQAEQAEQEGRYDDAERMYSELCRRHMQAGGDFQFAQMCAGRIEELRRFHRTSGALASRPPGPITGTTTSMSKSSNLSNIAGLSPPPPLPGAGNSSRIQPAPQSNPERASGPGVLRRSAVRIDGVQAYALETPRGQLLYYVTPTPGLDLEPFVGQRVELMGTTRIRGDVRGADHLTATRVFDLRR